MWEKMKNIITLVLLSLVLTISLSTNALAVTINYCTHGGNTYSFNPNGGCPDYVGSDAGLSSGWTHYHAGDNSTAYNESSEGIINGDNVDHCTIAKEQNQEPLN